MLNCPKMNNSWIKTGTFLLVRMDSLILTTLQKNKLLDAIL